MDSTIGALGIRFAVWSLVSLHVETIVVSTGGDGVNFLCGKGSSVSDGKCREKCDGKGRKNAGAIEEEPV